MDASQEDALNKIKHIRAHDTLVIYPDFNWTFKIHNDAGAFQLGEVMSQEGKTIALYIRKLTYDQKRYTVIWK